MKSLKPAFILFILTLLPHWLTAQQDSALWEYIDVDYKSSYGYAIEAYLDSGFIVGGSKNVCGGGRFFTIDNIYYPRVSWAWSGQLGYKPTQINDLLLMPSANRTEWLVNRRLAYDFACDHHRRTLGGDILVIQRTPSPPYWTHSNLFCEVVENELTKPYIPEISGLRRMAWGDSNVVYTWMDPGYIFCADIKEYNFTYQRLTEDSIREVASLAGDGVFVTDKELIRIDWEGNIKDISRGSFLSVTALTDTSVAAIGPNGLYIHYASGKKVYKAVTIPYNRVKALRLGQDSLLYLLAYRSGYSYTRLVCMDLEGKVLWETGTGPGTHAEDFVIQKDIIGVTGAYGPGYPNYGYIRHGMYQPLQPNQLFVKTFRLDGTTITKHADAGITEVIPYGTELFQNGVDNEFTWDPCRMNPNVWDIRSRVKVRVKNFGDTVINSIKVYHHSLYGDDCYEYEGKYDPSNFIIYDNLDLQPGEDTLLLSGFLTIIHVRPENFYMEARELCVGIAAPNGMLDANPDNDFVNNCTIVSLSGIEDEKHKASPATFWKNGPDLYTRLPDVNATVATGSIIDMQGREIPLSSAQVMGDGQYRFHLTQVLAPGIYACRIVAGGKLYYGKVMVE